MLHCDLPEETPFHLTGVIAAEELPKYLQATMTFNADRFAGFPRDFLWLDNLSARRTEDPNCIQINVTICESIWELYWENKLPGQVWNRSDFGALFEHFWLHLPCECGD